MSKALILLSIAILLITSCGLAATPQVIVITATEESTKVPTETSTATSTYTQEPTNTPKPTSTKRPTNTPTQTVEPRLATQTEIAIHLEATRAYNQNIDDIRKECLPIDWVELSEVQYAKDHEGKCVYIRAVVFNINWDEELLDTWIGYYSANLVLGIGDLNNQNGRLTDDMWVNVYGRVTTDTWIWTNYTSGIKTASVGIHTRLLEGPNGLIWVHE